MANLSPAAIATLMQVKKEGEVCDSAPSSFQRPANEHSAKSLVKKELLALDYTSGSGHYVLTPAGEAELVAAGEVEVDSRS